MCVRSKSLISEFKNKITRLETEIQICNTESNRLEEELRAERRMRTLTSTTTFVGMLFTVFVAVFLAVLVAI